MNPELKAEELKNILKNSANKTIHPRYSFNEKGWNKEVGYGRIDAKSALELAESLQGKNSNLRSQP